MEKDTDRNIIELQPAFETARLKAIDFTTHTGREYGILLGPQGILAELEGTKENVDFTSFQHLLRKHWLVHTHPRNTSLSVDDTLVMESQGMAGVTALTPDGSIFTAQSTGKLHPRMVRPLMLLQNTAMLRANFLRDDEGYAGDDTTLAMSHAMNLLLARDGLINYTYKLSDKARSVWKQFKDIA